MSATGASASYVYAVTRPFDPAWAAAVPGVGDRPVRQVALGGLAAVVSTVDLDEFGEDALRVNLERLPWLEAVARAHHAVVDLLVGVGPVVPFRLATVYLDDGRVRSELTGREAQLGACLNRLDGRTEWSVKVLWEPPPDEPGPSEPADDRPGTAFLRRRTAARAGAAGARRAAVEQVERLHAALAAASVADLRYAPQPSQLTGESREMLLNGAYLVQGAGPGALAAVVAEHGAGPLHCDLAGPWAPYSFARLEEEP